MWATASGWAHELQVTRKRRPSAKLGLPSGHAQQLAGVHRARRNPLAREPIRQRAEGYFFFAFFAVFFAFFAVFFAFFAAMVFFPFSAFADLFCFCFGW